MSMMNETDERGSWLNDEQIKSCVIDFQFYTLMPFL